MKKRILAMALTAAMMISLFPASVFALPESQPTASSSEIVAQLNESASGDSQPAASEKTNSEPTAASEKAVSSEATSSEATSSEAASSEAASSEAASSEAANSEAASSEVTSSEPAQAEGDISAASENGERKICLPPFCPSKPKGQWVYVYTKVQSNNPELIKDLVINKDGYYTLGRVWVEGMKSPEPNFIGTWNGSIKKEKAKVINALNNNKIERYTLNQNIDLTKVDFSNKGVLKREEHGATDYDVDEGWTWHLDGMLNIEDIGAVTFKYVCNGEEITESKEKVPFSAGTTLDFTKGSADYNAYVKQVDGYTCIGVTPETYTVESAKIGVVTFQYAEKLLEGNINAPAAEDLIYDGQEHKWVPTVTDGSGNPLKLGQDYELAYSHDDGDFINVTNKDITVTITGKGNYTGTVTRKYRITPRPVTLTSATASKPYDGTPLEKHEVNVSKGNFVVGEGVDYYTVTGKQTDAGSSDNEFTYTLNENTLEKNYEIKCEFGTLTVTRKSIDPQTGANMSVGTLLSVEYDGKSHKQEPTVKDGQKDLEKDVDYELHYDGDTVNVGYVAGDPLSVGQIPVTVVVKGKGNYEGEAKVTYFITPRPVTLTPASDSKPYDGTPLTNSNVTVSGRGFVDGQVTDIKATGSVTNVSEGKVPNTIELTKADSFNIYNYAITMNKGELEITPRPVTLTSASDSKTYDGTPLEKHEVNVSEGNFVKGEGVAYKFSGSQKDAGSSDNAYEIDWDKSTAKKDNYKIENKFGTLTINRRTLTISTDSASKTYDGSDLTASGHSIDGLVKGETVNFSITGRQKEVGSSDNTYVIDWNKSTAKQGNYKIENKLGKLTVTSSGSSSGGSSSGGGSSSTPTPAPEQAPTPTPVPVIVPAAPTPAPTPVRRVAPAATATPAPTAKPTETIAESEPPKAESEPEVIEDEETPLAPMANGKWALVNLVLMILTVLASLLMLLGVIGKKRGRNNKSFWRIASLIPAIGALAAFVLTENMKLPMAMVDRWTLLMVIIAVLQGIVAVMSKKQNESEDDGANA